MERYEGLFYLKATAYYNPNKRATILPSLGTLFDLVKPSGSLRYFMNLGVKNIQNKRPKLKKRI